MSESYVFPSSKSKKNNKREKIKHLIHHTLRTSSKIPAVPEPKIRAAAVLLSPDELPAALRACTLRTPLPEDEEEDEEEGVYMTTD